VRGLQRRSSLAGRFQRRASVSQLRLDRASLCTRRLKLGAQRRGLLSRCV